MFFVIAGVQPKTRILDAAARRCPRCGLHQARTRRVDHYFSLFFVPLIRVKQGTPFLFCERCGEPTEHGDDRQVPGGPAQGIDTRNCSRCGRTLQPGFVYCPHCGQRQ